MRPGQASLFDVQVNQHGVGVLTGVSVNHIRLANCVQEPIEGWITRRPRRASTRDPDRHDAQGDLIRLEPAVCRDRGRSQDSDRPFHRQELDPALLDRPPSQTDLPRHKCCRHGHGTEFLGAAHRQEGERHPRNQQESW